jgi:exodeoxyribonuclease-3
MAWGFVDLFRLHHPEPGHYTFFDYRVKDSARKGFGWRVDHVLATRRVATRCSDCRIDMAPRLKPKASDHTFVVADLRL